MVPSSRCVDFFFPTNAEHIIWLVSSFCVTLVLLCVVVASTRELATAIKVVNASDGTPEPLSTHIVILYLGGALVYVIARMFLNAESFACLRALPATAYESAVWPNFSHF